MKFKKLVDSVELPEKVEGGYINVRSNERADIRPGETRMIFTGISFSASKNDIARLVGQCVVETPLEPGEYRPLNVTIHNPTDRSLLIYVGQTIASILIEETEQQEVKKRKTTILTSTATLIEPEQEVGFEAAFTKKPCGDCP